MVIMKKGGGIKEWDGQHVIKAEDIIGIYGRTPLKTQEAAI